MRVLSQSYDPKEDGFDDLDDSHPSPFRITITNSKLREELSNRSAQCESPQNHGALHTHGGYSRDLERSPSPNGGLVTPNSENAMNEPAHTQQRGSVLRAKTPRRSEGGYVAANPSVCVEICAPCDKTEGECACAWVVGTVPSPSPGGGGAESEATDKADWPMQAYEEDLDLASEASSFMNDVYSQVSGYRGDKNSPLGGLVEFFMPVVGWPPVPSSKFPSCFRCVLVPVTVGI